MDQGELGNHSILVEAATQAVQIIIQGTNNGTHRSNIILTCLRRQIDHAGRTPANELPTHIKYCHGLRQLSLLHDANIDITKHEKTVLAITGNQVFKQLKHKFMVKRLRQDAADFLYAIWGLGIVNVDQIIEHD